MISNLYFQYISFIYLILLGCVFYNKKRANNVETKIYSKLIINCFFCELFDILSTYAAHVGINHTILITLCKVYLFFLILFGYYMGYYLIKVSNFKKSKLMENIYRIVMLLSIGIVWILPLYSHSSDGQIYTYGPSAVAVYTYIGLCILFYSIVIFVKWEQITIKKIIPYFSFIVCIVLIALIQFFNPSLLVVTAGIVFVTFVMYFTIENPDMKLIEELNLAKERAERANRAKTDFLSNMSHEIRTPLNAIVGFSQALAEEDISVSAKEEVKDIIMSSNNLLEIVNGILDISKIEANKLEIVNVEYNSDKLFKEVISLTKARLASRPLDFKVEIDPTIPKVLYGDYIRIKQIIINILTNAVKYTKEGYILFTVNHVIQGDVCKLIMSVEDSGIGIKPEDIDKLFVKFQRLELEKNITTEGTGLGLAITKNLVELMNGKIVVQSKYGEGSKFTVSLTQRIVPKDVSEIEAAAEIDLKPFNAYGQKVLVVDDNNVNLKVANRLLKDYNVETILINSGQDCINKILDGEKFDLIFMDIMMPKMKGTEALKHLKNIIGFKTPVVALTADAISGMKERYISLGFDDYLAKPINKDQLCAVLRKYLKVNNTLQIIDSEQQKLPEDANVRNRTFLENNHVDVTHSLELLGDMEMYDMTIDEFCKEFNEKMTKIEEYKNTNDLNNYAILVHSMKSDAKYLGFMELADLAYKHEMSSKSGDADFVNQNFDALKQLANKFYEISLAYIGEQ